MAIKYRVRLFSTTDKMQDTHNKFSGEGFHPGALVNLTPEGGQMSILVTYVKDDRLDQIEAELQRQKEAADKMESFAGTLGLDDSPGLIT